MESRYALSHSRCRPPSNGRIRQVCGSELRSSQAGTVQAGLRLGSSPAQQRSGWNRRIRSLALASHLRHLYAQRGALAGSFGLPAKDASILGL